MLPLFGFWVGSTLISGIKKKSRVCLRRLFSLCTGENKNAEMGTNSPHAMGNPRSASPRHNDVQQVQAEQLLQGRLGTVVVEDVIDKLQEPQIAARKKGLDEHSVCLSREDLFFFLGSTCSSEFIDAVFDCF